MFKHSLLRGVSFLVGGGAVCPGETSHGEVAALSGLLDRRGVSSDAML